MQELPYVVFYKYTYFDVFCYIWLQYWEYFLVVTKGKWQVPERKKEDN